MRLVHVCALFLLLPMSLVLLTSCCAGRHEGRLSVHVEPQSRKAEKTMVRRQIRRKIPRQSVEEILSVGQVLLDCSCVQVILSASASLPGYGKKPAVSFQKAHSSGAQ